MITPPHTATEWIEHILERFHETHRRELPQIVQLAREAEALGVSGQPAAELQALGQALEAHMFKEEMRLFPMMEQGGNTLIEHLIDDMDAEHRRHEDEMARVGALLAAAAVPAAAQAPWREMRAAVDKLFDDLRQHIHAEDEVLFPMFLPPR